MPLTTNQPINRTQTSRRDFLQKSALLGSTLFFSNCFSLPVFGKESGTIAGSRLAATAFTDDCFRLVSVSGQVPEIFRKVLIPNLNEHVPGNTARLARAIPNGKTYAVQILSLARSGLTGDQTAKFADEKLALALGLLAADAYRQGVSIPVKAPAAGVYLDAAILKDMNGKNPAETISGNPADLADLFAGMVPRMLTRMHTTIPDDDDAEQWILRVDQWRRDTQAYFNTLARTYMSPDRKKLEQWISGSRVYSPGDELIRTARSLQKGPAGAATRTLPFELAKNQSAYARALIRGYRSVVAAAEFFEGKMDENRLNTVLAEV
jgi:hypothetical protein